MPRLVYEVILADVTAESLIAVLNEPEVLTGVFVRHKTLVGFVYAPPTPH